jgi:hypothetical protein
MGKWRYNFMHLSTSAIDINELSISHPGPFSPRGKNLPYPVDRRLDGSKRWLGRFGVEEDVCLAQPVT